MRGCCARSLNYVDNYYGRKATVNTLYVVTGYGDILDSFFQGGKIEFSYRWVIYIANQSQVILVFSHIDVISANI